MWISTSRALYTQLSDGSVSSSYGAGPWWTHAPREKLSSLGDRPQENRDQIQVPNLLADNLRHCPFKFTYSLLVYEMT